MAKRRSTTRQWLRQQDTDPFVKQRDAEGFRSRAAFKLKDILARDRLIHKGAAVLDLGASPGGWSQVAATAVGANGVVVAVDVLPMAPIENVVFIQGDARSDEIQQQIWDSLGGRKLDLVISDIAPNITGIKDLDEANFLELAETVGEIANRALVNGGSLVLKLFQYAGTDAYIRELKKVYAAVSRRKPDSSRKGSREFYVVAQGIEL